MHLPPRVEMFYFTDDGNLSALRYGQWKMMFSEQRAHGFGVWQVPGFFCPSISFELANHTLSVQNESSPVSFLNYNPIPRRIK